MFEQWKEQELAEIKERFGKARLLTIGLMALVGFNMLGGVVMLLDGGGAMEAVVIFVQVVIMALIWKMGDYKSRFIKPLLASVEEVLPSQGEREEFARQMGTAAKLPYSPAPQVKPCTLWLGEGYLYFRQPGKSRVVRNRDIRRATLAKNTYTVGRSHMRTCYDLALYTEGEKPVWKASFLNERAAYEMLERLKFKLPANLAVEDGIAYSKTPEGRKAEGKELAKAMALAVVLVAVLMVVLRLLRRG